MIFSPVSVVLPNVFFFSYLPKPNQRQQKASYYASYRNYVKSTNQHKQLKNKCSKNNKFNQFCSVYHAAFPLVCTRLAPIVDNELFIGSLRWPKCAWTTQLDSRFTTSFVIAGVEDYTATCNDKFQPSRKEISCLLLAYQGWKCSTERA